MTPRGANPPRFFESSSPGTPLATSAGLSLRSPWCCGCWLPIRRVSRKRGPAGFSTQLIFRLEISGWNLGEGQPVHASLAPADDRDSGRVAARDRREPFNCPIFRFVAVQPSVGNVSRRRRVRSSLGPPFFPRGAGRAGRGMRTSVSRAAHRWWSGVIARSHARERRELRQVRKEAAVPKASLCRGET